MMLFLFARKKSRRPDPARVLRRFMRLLETRVAPRAPHDGLPHGRKA